MNILNTISYAFIKCPICPLISKNHYFKHEVIIQISKRCCRLMAQIHRFYSRGKLNKSYSSESNPVTAYNSVTVRDWTGNCKWITPEACTWTHVSKTVLKIYKMYEYKKGTNEEKNKLKKWRIRKKIKKKHALVYHYNWPIKWDRSTSCARVQKTTPLSFFLFACARMVCIAIRTINRLSQWLRHNVVPQDAGWWNRWNLSVSTREGNVTFQPRSIQKFRLRVAHWNRFPLFLDS